MASDSNGMQFKARAKTVSKRQSVAKKVNATGTKLPTMPMLKSSAGSNATTQAASKGKAKGKAKGKGRTKVSGTRTIDYQDLAPGVRVAQTPGM